MGIEKLIPMVVTIVMMAAATGRLPMLTREVQIAQLRLLKASQSSRWGQALLLPTPGEKSATRSKHVRSGRSGSDRK